MVQFVENNQAVYISTFAEGVLMNPEQVTHENIHLLARTWKKSQTIVQFRLFGLEERTVDGVSRNYLTGDIGAAKVIMPTQEEYSGIVPHRALWLLDHWVAAVVEDYDFADEANPVLMLNRKKALLRMQDLNQKRIAPGSRVYGSVEGELRGAYRMNVGGYDALLPKSWYDWDFHKRPYLGEWFEVKVSPTQRNGALVVSRRDLLQNPLEDASRRIRKDSIVSVTVSHIYRNLLKGEISPGVRISISSSGLHKMARIDDRLLVRVRGHNGREFYGHVESVSL